MSDKIQLNPSQGTYDVTQINANFALIEEHLNEKVFYRVDAGGTNTPTVDIDMNSKRILNLPKPIHANEPVRKADVISEEQMQGYVDQAAGYAVDAGNAAEISQNAANTVANAEQYAIMATQAKNAAITAKDQAVAAAAQTASDVTSTTQNKNTAVTAASTASDAASTAADARDTAVQKAADATTAAATATTKASGAAASATTAQYWAGQAATNQIQSDWSVSDTTSKAFILHKPSVVTAFANDAGYVTATANVASATKLQTGRTLAITGDLTWTSPTFDGSTSVTAVGTLASSGVTAGTYNNSATAVTPITVDAKGRVTGTGATVTITPAWTSVTGKPTTVAGYGITDALLTTSVVDNLTSTSTTAPLSANQGKLLNDQLGNISAILATI